MEHLFDVHPEVEQVRRVFVDVSAVNFMSSDRLELFYGSSGYSLRMERYYARELRELRSGAYGPGDLPDLGQDAEYELDVARHIQARACEDLAGGSESAEHEEMWARGAVFATIDEFRISTRSGRRPVDIVLTYISFSNGDSLEVLPWEQEEGGLSAVPGEWVEVDAEVADQASVDQMLSEARQAIDAEGEQTIDQAIRAVWGDEFDLPDVVDEVIDEADKWKEQLRAEFGDEDDEAALGADEDKPSAPPAPAANEEPQQDWEL